MLEAGWPRSGLGEVGEQTREELLPVVAGVSREHGLAHPLGVGHQAEDVLPAGEAAVDAGDRVHAAVRVGLGGDRAVLGAVAQADEAFALEAAERLFAGLIAA